MRTFTLPPGEEEPPVDLEDGPRTSIVPEPEQRFGRYRLCFELASGGMGKVFLARAEGPAGFEQFVALKRIHAHLSQKKGFVDMFLDEARITSRITHPNVCSIIDFGEASGTYYIAMEYLFGEPLSRVISTSLNRDVNDPRRVTYTARILAAACEGLHAAHELRGTDGRLLQVIHRDVSPHNIFVTYDGGVRVVDFGIARATDQLHETTTGSVKGKWAYMSPEQARGQAIDRRADIWSLGVVLWEAAAGQRLFRRSNQTETVLAVVEQEVRPPSHVNPAVPPEIDEIAMRALSRNVEDRWKNARAMAQALNHFLARRGQPVGLVEVAEWMDEIFPGAAARKHDLLASARHSKPGAFDSTFPDTSEVRVTASVGPEPVSARRKRDRTHSGETVPAKLAASSSAGLPGESKDWPSSEPTSVLSQPARAPRRGRSVLSLALILLAGVVVLPAILFRTEIADLFQGSSTQMIDADGSTPALGDAPPADAPPADAPPADAPPADARPPEDVEEPTPPIEPAEPEPASPAAPPEPETTTTEEPPARRRGRRRHRSESADRARGVGRVTVVTTGGWALVYEGRTNLGETPASLSLPAGRHVLEIRPQGRRPGIRRVVTVEPDGHHRVSVRLSP